MSNNAKLPAAVRNAVWLTYIGRTDGVAFCFCCHLEEISRANFECGHIVSRANGGTDRIVDMRPVCSLCNKSMGTRNMIEFQLQYGFTPLVTASSPHTASAAPVTQQQTDVSVLPRQQQSNLSQIQENTTENQTDVSLQEHKNPDGLSNQMCKIITNAFSPTEERKARVARDAKPFSSSNWFDITTNESKITLTKHTTVDEKESSPKYNRVDDNKFSCANCGKVFSKEMSVVAHLRTHSDAVKIPVVGESKCSGCRRKFKYAKAFVRHIRKCVKFRRKIVIDDLELSTAEQLEVSLLRQREIADALEAMLHKSTKKRKRPDEHSISQPRIEQQTLVANGQESKSPCTGSSSNACEQKQEVSSSNACPTEESGSESEQGNREKKARLTITETLFQ